MHAHTYVHSRYICIPYTQTYIYKHLIFSPHGAIAPSGPGPPHYRGFTIILRHNTLGRTPLDEWSAQRRDLYLTTYNIQKRQTSTAPAGIEPAISASGRPQTHAFKYVIYHLSFAFFWYTAVTLGLIMCVWVWAATYVICFCSSLTRSFKS